MAFTFCEHGLLYLLIGGDQAGAG